MLGTAMYLKVDLLVFWQYESGRGWIRYSAEETESFGRETFLIQCMHSAVCKAFHCEPLCEWPIEELVLLNSEGCKNTRSDIDVLLLGRISAISDHMNVAAVWQKMPVHAGRSKNSDE